MAKRSKCKYCNEYIDIGDLIIKLEITAKGTEKKIKLHKQCEQEYIELMEYKENEIKWFKELFEHIRGVLGYSGEQIMPNYLITRLQDLRNGTIMERGIGRIARSKDGYKYEVILDTFLTHSDKIEWCFKNKTFKNEKNKINYMMAIVENNINDNYIYFKEKNLSDIVKERNNLLEEEQKINLLEIKQKLNQNLSQVNNIKQENKKGISKFLDEEDF